MKRWHPLLLTLPMLAGCAFIDSSPCKYICSYTVDCAEEQWDDYDLDCSWEDEDDVYEDCIESCTDEWKDLDGDEKKEVKACVKCVEDEVGDSCDADDWYDANYDDCEDECDDGDVEDFYEDFYDDWDATDEVECDGYGTYTSPPYTTTGDDDDDDDDTGPTTTGNLVVSANWTDDGQQPQDTDGDSLPDVGCGDSVQITIQDPLGEPSWSFGMAETGQPNGWTGEDCYMGYAWINVCHSVGINSSIPEVTSCSALDVTDGRTLLDASKDPFLTYFLEDSLGNCFVWGHDTSYYGPMVCTPMS